ncbi:MAG: hypothetical protein IE884_06640 [Sulfuricurvum sp.]|nr:hypothetical protein [Sulfuricurvum sp.]
MRFLLLSDVTHFASKARKAYERFQNDPSSAVAQYAENENFILHFRKSAGRYIIAAEPFKTADEAKAFQKKSSRFKDQSPSISRCKPTKIL